jgi:hypothetical protein
MSLTLSISNPQRLDKNTLVGEADVDLPCGVTLRRVMLHRKGDKYWFAFQSQEYLVGQEKRYAQTITFVSPEAKEAFKAEVIPGLMLVLGEMGS